MIRTCHEDIGLDSIAARYVIKINSGKSRGRRRSRKRWLDGVESGKVVERQTQSISG